MGKRAAIAGALLCGLRATAACRDYLCFGTTMCSDGEFGGDCAEPRDCPSTAIQFADDVIQIRGWRCRVTLEQIRLVLPESITKVGTEFTLFHKIWVRDGAILEIHGASEASDPDAAVSLLKLKVRACESSLVLPLVACCRGDLFLPYLPKLSFLGLTVSFLPSNETQRELSSLICMLVSPGSVVRRGL